MSLNNLHRWLFVVILTVLTALLGLVAAAVPSAAATMAAAAGSPPVSLAASAAPRLPSGAALVGPVSPAATMAVTVTLAIPDQAALTAFLNGLADPASPYYQHYLAPGQFGPMFGPSLDQVAAVENALRAAGLSPGPVAPDRLSIPVTATASAVEHAFGVTLDRYRLAGGRIGFANTTAPKIPAAVAPLVQGVLGLNDLYPVQHAGGPVSGPSPAGIRPAGIRAAETRILSRMAATTGTAGRAVNPGPQPCSLIAPPNRLFGFTATDIAAGYGLAQRYVEGDFGQGARVGVVELEPNLTSDITAYEQCYRISTKVTYTKVDGGAGSGAGSGEAALDIEVIAGLAPRAVVDVFQAPNNGNGRGGGLYGIFRKWVTADTDKILSSSWGNCEAITPAADAQAQEALFEQANAQGQTLVQAAGDSGSTGCSTDAVPDARLSTLSQASDPFVIGVGGTHFKVDSSNNTLVDFPWNESDLAEGAGGGGVSALWCMPAYQHDTAIPGVINSDSVKDATSCASGFFREVPDISALADPVDGYAVFISGQWAQAGGTSAAAPVWAAIAALTDASGFCSAYGSKGAFLPQTLYAVAGTFHSYIYAPSPQGLDDVTSAAADSFNPGNNDYTPSGYTGGLYPATRGYDMATGVGVPMVAGNSGLFRSVHSRWHTFLTGLTQLLCHQSATKAKTVKVMSVSPATGRAGKATKVVVHGSGFFPVPFADEAQVISGGKVLATVFPSCTATACTFTVPAETARTVDIRIFASSLWSSRLTTADRYRYV